MNLIAFNVGRSCPSSLVPFGNLFTCSRYATMSAYCSRGRLAGLSCGIEMRIRQVDSAQYELRRKTFDFDMLQWTWPASLSPGNEQINRWSSRQADNEGSLNLVGARNPAADAMIEALLRAEAEPDFIAAVRAFDRVLMSGDYVIPLFYLPKVWVAYWSHLGHPATAPLAKRANSRVRQPAWSGAIVSISPGAVACSAKSVTPGSKRPMASR